MNIIKFGRLLIKTEDLDPIYTMLWRAQLPEKKLHRWLLAYWFFYHAGVASNLSEYKGQSFFTNAMRLAIDPKTPRGTERRHFRGKKAIDCVKYFQSNYNSATQAVTEIVYLLNLDMLDFDSNAIIGYISDRWPMFGPWMGFKIADMLERLKLKQIKFRPSSLEMYRDPIKGAKLYASKHKDVDWGKDVVTGVVRHLMREFSDYKAPPRYERPINVQEVETILCKWKSHLNNHYPVGKDTKEIRHGLKGWGKTARRLRECLPKIT